MNTIDSCVLITNTYYKTENHADSVRCELAVKMIQQAEENGYHILVLDNGSSPELKEKLESVSSHFISSSFKGMGEGRREVMQKGYDTGKHYLLWLEPEKIGLINSVKFIINPLVENTADIVFPHRKSFDTYPIVQQYSEQFINEYLGELTRLKLDYTFGPKAWKREITSYMLSYDGEYGDKWDAILIPFIKAYFEKKLISDVVIDYAHPQEQTEFEDNDIQFYKKRLEQLNLVISSTENYWNKLNKNHSL